MDTSNDNDSSAVSTASTDILSNVFRFTLPSKPDENRNSLNLFGNASPILASDTNLNNCHRQVQQLADIFRSSLLHVDESQPLNLRCSMCLNQRLPANFRSIDELISHFQDKHQMKAVFLSQ